MNRIDLAGRHAVVTGGAQGIGFAIAQRLALSGASIALWDRDTEALRAASHELEAHAEISSHQTEMTGYASVEAAVASTIRRHGSIDVLVCSAGIAGPNFNSWEYPLEDWRRVIDINLLGVYHCCRAVIPHMIEQNYGRIINIASIAGKEGNPNASAYSASKAGVIALTKSLGKETAARNIAVNCITPSVAKTKLFEQMTQAQIDYMLAKVPRARFVELDEIASMVAWLVSEENSFTTAAVFDLSGGRATY